MSREIKELFAAVLQVPVDFITDATTPDTISQWDSMNHLHLIAVFEERFSINIEPEEIPLMRDSYNNFCSVVLKKMAEVKFQ